MTKYSKIIQVAIVASLLIVSAIKLAEPFNPYGSKPSEPQLYTVHFDGIDYQDLKQVFRGSNYNSYTTKAGKRIEFRGNFYEVEQ